MLPGIKIGQREFQFIFRIQFNIINSYDVRAIYIQNLNLNSGAVGHTGQGGSIILFFRIDNKFSL
jgi:hypothetical protein